jgi:hypothetical protein
MRWTADHEPPPAADSPTENAIVANLVHVW